ncbi:hypothetical protein BQ6471_02156 [Vibrio gazogenes]|nr:hypothetical protein BQ6471_02156 [Vibrio gazogenes]
MEEWQCDATAKISHTSIVSLYFAQASLYLEMFYIFQ